MYLLLVVSHVLVINPVITQMYSLQEEIPEITDIIIIREYPKFFKSKRIPRLLLTMSTVDIPVFNTLQRLHTLPMSCDSHSSRGVLLPIDHFLDDLAWYHYIAFTKILLVYSCPLGFASRTNTVLLPKVSD
jgi:hypothetical protein